MTEDAPNNDRLRAWLSMLAAAGMIAINVFAAKGWINGVTPSQISLAHPTMVTPAGYAFSIWTLIYVGVAAFAVYQLLPRNLRLFRGTRTFFILSCALNCGWIFLWLHNQIAASFAVNLLLFLSTLLIMASRRETETYTEYWISKAPFELYGGWVAAVTAANLAATLASFGLGVSHTVNVVLSIALILLVTAVGIIVRIRFTAYLFPLAIAWAAAAIGVQQSGNTLVVAVAAIAIIASMIASLTVILTLPTTQDRA